MIKTVSLIIFFMISLINANELGKKIETLYQKGDYQQALVEYQALLQQTPTSVELLYNMGNTYFKLKQTGLAIVFYKRALKLKPYDQDILDNLNFARSVVTDDMSQEAGFLQSIIEWMTILPKNYLFYLLMASLSLTNILILYMVLRKKQNMINVIIGLVISSMFIGILFFYKKQNLDQVEAVIIGKKIAVHSGPSHNLPILFYIHEGNEVTINKSSEKWVEIELKNGFQGWVLKKDCINI